MTRIPGLLSCFVLAGGLALGGGAALAADAPGQRFSLDPNTLPPPNATESVANSPEEVARPAEPPLQVPEGFRVNLFADGLANARWLAVAPNGDVLLAQPSAGEVTLLRDSDGDGRAELIETFASGFNRPHGLAFSGDRLYVADVRRVWRLPWKPGDTRPTGEAEPVTDRGALGTTTGHWTRNLAFSPDGSRFFVAIGSSGNIQEEPLPRASVQSFAAAGDDQQTFASGLRNPVGIAVYPGTQELYVVVNERDGLGDGLVPDYLTRLQPGGFYGWPYAYIGPHPQPEFPSRPDLVDKTIVPDLLFESHSAPLGLVFYDAGQFPAEYRGDAFVALHGSWNAARPTGYKVVRVPFDDGRPAGYYENFLTGFRLAEPNEEGAARVWGRPVGLAVAADGSLLVADDVSNAVWRVSYGR